MPSGLPTVEQIMAGEVSFFSIDTDLIQAKGYDFNTGALNQLPNQLPHIMQLQMTQVVQEEIVKHRMESVKDSIHKFSTASSNLKRLASLPMENIDASFEAINPAEKAAQHFRNQVEAYAQKCRGGILDIEGGDLAKVIFDLYFRNAAPFGKRKDKKSEFPDATSLVLLENYANQEKKKGIIASGDGGWEEYAGNSRNLYAVKSIEELANLFVATNEHAKLIKQRIIDAINDQNSELNGQLADSIRIHFDNAEWDTSGISSITGRVEAETGRTRIVDYSLETIGVWLVEGEPNKWIVEIQASVNLEIDLFTNFFVWDSIDHEEVSIGGNSEIISQNLDVDLFLTCDNVQLTSEADDWKIDIEISNEQYSVGEFELEVDLSDD